MVSSSSSSRSTTLRSSRSSTTTVPNAVLAAKRFKKRMPTIMRKASQLQTLCGIPVTVVCFDANGEIETFPKDKSEARKRVLEYKKFGGDEKRCNVISMLEASKKKLVTKLAREIATIFSNLAEIPDSSSANYSSLDTANSLDAALKHIEEKMETLKSGSGHHSGSLLGSQATVKMDTRCMESTTTTTSSPPPEDDFFLDLDDILAPATTSSPPPENDFFLDLDDILAPATTSSPPPEDDFFLELDDILAPNCNDPMAVKDFGNPIQECYSNPPLVFEGNAPLALTEYYSGDSFGFGPSSSECFCPSNIYPLPLGEYHSGELLGFGPGISGSSGAPPEYFQLSYSVDDDHYGGESSMLESDWEATASTALPLPLGEYHNGELLGFGPSVGGNSGVPLEYFQPNHSIDDGHYGGSMLEFD